MVRREYAGFPIVVENEAGSTRQWHDRDGRVSGETLMRYDYGFIDGHMGADGEEVDCYLGPDEAAPYAYVVHQRKAPDYTAYDEDKVMLGFASEAEAKAAYLAHRNDGDRDPGPYGGMSVVPIDRFRAKLKRRQGTGPIRYEVAAMPEVIFTRLSDGRLIGRLIAFDAVRDPASGLVREHVWDYVCVEGRDEKDGLKTEFNADTLSEMVDNFIRRGDPVPIDYNHQSNYAKVNGAPAPALGFYGVLAVVWDGRIIKLGAARGYSADGTEPGIDLSRNGLWAYRCEVTELGQKLLPNFKFLSPTFTPDGVTREGEKIGYALAAVAATNTPWQPGTQITFEHGAESATNATKGGGPMAVQKLAAFSKFVKFDADADDKAIKQAIMAKLDDEAGAAAMEEAYNYEDAASRLEEMAKLYEDAHYEDDEEGGEEPHVSMRRMSAKFRKLGKMGKMGDPPFGGKETPSEEKAEEKAKQSAMQAFAQRLGIPLAAGMSSAQMFDAISAGTTPTSQLAALIAEGASKVVTEREAKAGRERAARRASELIEMACGTGGPAGAYPKANRDAWLSWASNPQTFDAAVATIKPFLPEGIDQGSLLFERVTTAGAPHGADVRAPSTAAAGGRDRKVVRNDLATFVEDGGRFSAMAIEWADAKEGEVKMAIDAMLSEAERTDPAQRLIMANKLLKQRRPDMWAAAEEWDLR